jgi:hypothetical protein
LDVVAVVVTVGLLELDLQTPAEQAPLLVEHF